MQSWAETQSGTVRQDLHPDTTDRRLLGAETVTNTGEILGSDEL